MKECGVYRVTGKRDYRGHPEGTEFVALIDPKAEHRAVLRGSIERIGTTVPKPGTYTFPDGWLPTHIESTHRGRESGPSH